MQFAEIRTIIKKECKDNGIKFYQGRGSTVRFKDGVRCNGFFYDASDKPEDDRVPVLAVATNSNTPQVLIHEYCHMQQYLESADVWLELGKGGEVWDWLMGKDYEDMECVDRSLIAYYKVEVDCERRSVELHQKWNTDQNIDEYIQKANAYTLFYFFMREHRQWYAPGREPYTLEEVWSQMPKDFTFDVVECYNKVHKLFEICI